MADRTDDGLLPCPFCGSAPVCNGHPGGVMGQIRCISADCFGPKTTASYKEDSIKQWNTRTAPQAPDTGEGMDTDLGDISKHAMNCGWYGELGNSGCTCALRLRQELATERTMHRAWRKRAEEAEATPPKPAPDALREAIARIIADDSVRVHTFYTQRLGVARKVADKILSLHSTGDQRPERPSPCERYVNNDAELVCRHCGGLVDMERSPPNCKEPTHL